VGAIDDDVVTDSSVHRLTSVDHDIGCGISP
jgi:hypothetical protein